MVHFLQVLKASPSNVITALVVALSLSATGGTATAQSPRTVRGTVTDVAARPVGATVIVLGSRWSTVARDDGQFEVSVPIGRWRLEIARLGYRTDTVEVVLPEGGKYFDLPPVRLVAAPLVLPGLTVRGEAAPAMAQTVTTETIRQVPPLGEPDVFRAVALLPGVSQPNDLKGRIHLAGGSSDETGVRLDGHPLQAPFHLLGLAGAFNVAALEQADVRIHHLPPSLDGQLSGVIDIQTRRLTDQPYREAVTGVLSSGATVSQTQLPGGLDLLASGRITYLDKVVEFLAPGARAGGDEIPLIGYRDAVVRIGRELPGGWRAEALMFHTRDALRTTGQDSSVSADRLAWGETLGGVSLVRSSTRWKWSARLGMNRASVLKGAASGPDAYVRSTRDWTSGALQVNRYSQGWQWSAGASLDHRGYEHEWRTTGLGREIFSPRTPDSYRGSDALSQWSAFGEVERDWGPRLSVAAGSRVSWVDGTAYPAPRLLATYRLRDDLRVDAALDRRFQFDAESEEPIEGNVTPPIFLLRTPRVADMAALVSEWEPSAQLLGGGGSLQLGMFHKRYRDRAVLPELGRDDPPVAFPGFTRIAGATAGLTLSGRWSRGEDLLVQGGYTYQRARERLEGTWYSTGWDAPHDVSLLGSTRVLGRWHLNAVYRGHSGRATTPVRARVYVASEEFETYLRARYIRGARNSVRVPAYHRIDVGTRRSWSSRGADWTFFAQVLNVFFRDNPIDYDWAQYFASLEDPSLSRYPRRGLPILPTLGIEVRW